MQDKTADHWIAVGAVVASLMFSALVDWLAGKVARRRMKAKVMKSWEFAQKVATYSPYLAQWCKELNPTFARKEKERIEEEKRQDENIEQTKQEVLREREKRLAAEETEESRKGSDELVMNAMERSRDLAKAKYELEE